MDISAFIKAWVTKYKTTPYDVNSGQCEHFAQTLCVTLPGARLQYIEEFVGWDSPDYPGGHIWVLYNGRLYDSETPLGVTHWTELPIYQRNIKRRGKCPVYYYPFG